MAEFCKQCAAEMDFPADFTDMFKDAGISPDGEVGFRVLCEGCGLAFITDDLGTCGAKQCHNKHGTDNVIISGSPEWRARADELN